MHHRSISLSCTFGDKSATTTVALVGDSRAQMWLDIFNNLGLSEHFKLVFMAKNGCPVPLGTYQTNNNGTVSKSTWSRLYVIPLLRRLNAQVTQPGRHRRFQQLRARARQSSPLGLRQGGQAGHGQVPGVVAKDVQDGGAGRISPAGRYRQPHPVPLERTEEIDSCNFVPSHTVDAENAAASPRQRPRASRSSTRHRGSVRPPVHRSSHQSSRTRLMRITATRPI